MNRTYTIHSQNNAELSFNCDLLEDNKYFELMSQNQINILGYLSNSSNHALVGEIVDSENKFSVVIKPSSYENPLLDFEWGTLAKREVASYEVSNLLGWNIVPPTLLRDVDDLECSVQLFIPHDPREHYFSIASKRLDDIEKFVVFDYLVNNADRKAGHIILEKNKSFELYLDKDQGRDENIDYSGKLWGIDHGLSFHVEDKLRTVIWDFSEKEISSYLMQDLVNIIDKLPDTLGNYLKYEEIKATVLRAEKLIANPFHRAFDETQRSFPWPLV